MADVLARRSATRIDLDAEQLWRDGTTIGLRPKTWAVLRYLIERPGTLVTKEELLDAVWSDTVVSEGTLNKSIGELRNALADDRDHPRYIETVSRRGFRWVDGAAGVHRGSATTSLEPASSRNRGEAAAPSVVGRDAELAALEACLQRAQAGSRQVVFVSGEAGAGKSTLVNAFLARLQDRPSILTAHAQCIEAYGQHEPYRPLLEATERLAAQADDGATIVEVLRSHAPTWLRQIPSLGAATAAVEEDSGMAPVRMLREMATALDEFARLKPIVLVLEDAHWADLATMDACSMVARRRDAARLMLIVTLRSADALATQHPVLTTKSDLVRRGHASEISIALFTATDVGRYVRERCAGLQIDPDFAAWIHRQTAGNPLFVRIVVDDLIQRGVLSQDSSGGWQMNGSISELREFVPDSLRELIERQVDHLSANERAVIDAASVLRTEFSATSVAAVAGVSEEDAEEACEALARRGQILRRAERTGAARTSPSGRFAFVHSIVQRSLHDRLPALRLRRLHLAAARRLEHEYAGREDAAAVELALHYAMAGETAQALAHLQSAAASVQRIPAPRDVIVIREQILDLVQLSPGLPGHRRQLVVALMDLAEARQLAFAVVDAQTNALCERVLELSVSLEDARECFLASMGTFSNRFYTGRYDEAREIGRRLLASTQDFPHPFMIKSAHFAIAGAAYRLGELDEASEHFGACLEHAAQSQQTYGWDFHLMSLSHLALLAFHRGQPDEARRLVREAELHGSRGGATPDAAVIPLFAFALALVGDNDEAMVRVERALAQSERLGAAAWIERARFVHGLLVSRQGSVAEGIDLMKASLARQSRNNLWIDRSAYCALLAGEMLRRGLAGARAVVDEGIACMQRTGERHFEGELQRIGRELPAS